MCASILYVTSMNVSKFYLQIKIFEIYKYIYTNENSWKLLRIGQSNGIFWTWNLDGTALQSLAFSHS